MNRFAALLSHFLIFSQRPHNLPDVSLDLVNTLKVREDIYFGVSLFVNKLIIMFDSFMDIGS